MDAGRFSAISSPILSDITRRNHRARTADLRMANWPIPERALRPARSATLASCRRWAGRAQDMQAKDVHHRRLSHLFGLVSQHWQINTRGYVGTCRGGEVRLKFGGRIRATKGWATRVA